MEAILARIIERIVSLQRFLISSHIRLDGDAIGSELALYHILRGMGKEVSIYNRDKVPGIYQFLPGTEVISETLGSPERFDAAFLLDCSELDRLGEQAGTIRKIPLLVNIDHHVSNRPFCELAWIDAEASSTGELIFQLAQALQVPITENIAINLYTAILTDTGSFRYTNTRAETFSIASRLVGMGAKPYVVAENVYEKTPVEKIRLLSKALKTLEFSWDGRICSILVSQEMMTEVGALPEHADSFADFARAIEGVEVGVFYTEISSRHFKVSFRSKGRIDVEKIAGSFGGGGHAAASACRLEGDYEEIKTRVTQTIRTGGL